MLVEQEVLPGIESGALHAEDIVVVVACLRRWEADGAWGKHTGADGERGQQQGLRRLFVTRAGE